MRVPPAFGACVCPQASPVAGPACFHALSSTRNRSSQHSHFTDNHCVLFQGKPHTKRGQKLLSKWGQS